MLGGGGGRSEREKTSGGAPRAPIVRKGRFPGEGPKSIKTLIERAEKTMEPSWLRQKL